MFFVTLFNQAKLDTIIQKAKQKMCGCTGCGCNPESSIGGTYIAINVGKNTVSTLEKEVELSRTVGFFENLSDAITLIEENKFDIHDDKFTYAVIEEIDPGAYSAARGNIDLYKWNETFGKYEYTLMSDEIIDYLSIDDEYHLSFATIG